MRSVTELTRDLVTLALYTGGGIILFFALLRLLHRYGGSVGGTIAQSAGSAATYSG